MIMGSNDAVGWRVPWREMLQGAVLLLVVVGVLVSKLTNPAEVLAELKEYPFFYFLLAQGAVFCAFGIDGIRMRILTRTTGVLIPWSTLTLVLMAANFLTLITPFAAGGAPLVVFMLVKKGMKWAQATAVVVLGGFATQLGLFVLATTVLQLTKMPPDIMSVLGYVIPLLFLYGSVLALLLVLLYRGRKLFFLTGKKKEEWMMVFSETFRSLLANKGRYFFSAMTAGFLYYAFTYMAAFFLLTGFGVAFGTPLVRYGISVLMGVTPLVSPLPGGMGAAEYAAFYILEGRLVADELATFIILWRSAVFYVPVFVGGLVFLYLLLRLGKNQSAM